MKTLTDGTCKFCGQIRHVEVEANSAKRMIDEAASMVCMCEQGAIYRQKEKAIKKINAEFEKDEKSIAELLIHAIDAIQNYEIEKVTVDSGGGIKGIIQKSNDSIKIKREDKRISESKVS